MAKQKITTTQISTSTPAWSTWSPTVVGWSSTTAAIYRYQEVGTSVTVQIYVTGTSNSVNTSVTLPFTAKTEANRVWDFVLRGRDNSGSHTSMLCEFGSGATQADFYSALTGTGWTASGTKEISLTFTYERAL